MPRIRKIDRMKWMPGVYILDTDCAGETHGVKLEHCHTSHINVAVLTEIVLRAMLAKGSKK
ncbi:hypothetical protein AVV28_gp31 [Achromobacter phage JWX]|uniref:Uncharacterized protein n=1 Tax=Achromobacter phage JWX TaxID=1589746 RepID=A0A0B4ZZC9_9CAUD|nr:hypothetical protein AVV28_gp31 [Achromobacter phage JWX]AJD82797.1 hypothetical protein JWX_00031 [Achromobacter phage JWX]WLW38450.1 hypothetical protein JWT_00026 [Achromobacter phage JWT]